MIQTLHIRNIALIDELEISLSQGFHILTGETGAGKSIIIDAVNFVLGERANRDLIQSGAESAAVEASFSTLSSPSVQQKLNEFGIPYEAGDELVFSRALYTNGKNVIRINGVLVNLGTLKSISDMLVDIHGQHDHQSLLRQDEHISFLDHFGKASISEKKRQVSELYQAMKKIEKQLLFGFTSEQERLQKIDILAYQINEIANARLIEGEEEQLDAQLRVLSNSQHIQTALEQSYDTLANEEGALVAISGARRTVQGIGALHEKFQEIYDRLDEAYYTIEDIIYTLRDLKNGNEYMPGQLEEVENRLAVIHALKRKYGANIAEILAFHENANMEHEALVKSEELKGALTAQLRTCQAQYTIAAAALSAARKEAATVLEQDILRQFADLGMEKSQFQVAITPLPSPSADGVDRVEFLLSANAGEPVKPLAKIASGGEISRIMLAFKTIQFGSIPSIIFDEIDTGISGHVASAVGLKMLQISKGHQVICITHLPQIAALADAHYYVEKIEKDGHTSTVLHTLTDEQRVTELARIMGAGRHDVQAMNHAAELIQRANSLKEKY